MYIRLILITLLLVLSACTELLSITQEEPLPPDERINILGTWKHADIYHFSDITITEFDVIFYAKDTYAGTFKAPQFHDEMKFILDGDTLRIPNGKYWHRWVR